MMPAVVPVIRAMPTAVVLVRGEICVNIESVMIKENVESFLCVMSRVSGYE